jgi:putative nucleotidyltransferase with HDIG domain
VGPLTAKQGVVLDALPKDVVPQPDLREKALRSLGSLPPFSPILTRLLAALAAEDVSFAGLGDLIEKDTVVAANILHLVNSALYARRGSISSVRHAISLLGANKLRNAVLGMSIARVWNRVKMPATWSMARFNMHSAAVAVLSDLLSQRLPVVYPEGAFVAGLLHDVGRLLIALALPEEHERVIEMFMAGGRSMTNCEMEVLGFTHAELSAEALRYWKLPEEIQLAVRDHHSSPVGSTGGIPLSHVVDAANQYANSTGLSILVKNPAGSRQAGQNQDSADGSAVEVLGLDTEKLQALLAEFRTENNAMSVYFR